jgi:hypothetical protein
MKAKEKAKELFNKFNPHSLTTNWYGDDVEVQSTKQCALIACDEILALDYLDSVFLPFSSQTLKEYWQQVKIEINNL